MNLNNCSICMDEIVSPTGQQCSECRCWNHIHCLQDWYSHSPVRSCPLCRAVDSAPLSVLPQNTTKIVPPWEEVIINKIERYLCKRPRFGLGEFIYRCNRLIYLKNLIRNGSSYIGSESLSYDGGHEIDAVDYAQSLLSDSKFIQCWFFNEAKTIVEEYIRLLR